MEPAISLKNISKEFKVKDKKIAVLKDIDMEIKKREFFVILGPSGVGKSTLLRIMSGLEKDFSGEVVLGKDTKKEDFGFVFQQFALMPWLSVYNNVKFSLTSKNLSDQEKDLRVKKTLEMLGLIKVMNSYPYELSGGMKQRVGIARALVINPKVIFMDEPFSELDSFTTEQLRDDMLSIWKKDKPTIIMVTHSIDDAIKLADRIAIISSSPARIKKIIVNKMKRPRKLRSEEAYKIEDYIFKLIKED